VRFWLARRSLAEIPAVLETRQEGCSKLDRWRELKSHARLILNFAGRVAQCQLTQLADMLRGINKYLIESAGNNSEVL